MTSEKGAVVTVPPANWYPDPRDSTMMRYWDGTAWTGHTQARPQPAQQVAQPTFQQTPQVAQPTFQPQPQAVFQPQPQAVFQPTPQATFQPQPQAQFEPAPQAAFQPAPQAAFQPAPQTTFQPAPQAPFQQGEQPLAPVAQPSSWGLDAMGGRTITPGFGNTMTPAFGSGRGTYSAQALPVRTSSKRGLWLGLGVGGALILAVIAAVVVVVLPKFAQFSPDYTGAPVTSSDVAPAGSEIVISPSRSVALEIPNQWHDLQEYADLESAIGDSPEGATVVGAWFTQAPTSAASPPQLILVMEFSPSAIGLGTMDDLRGQYLGGLETTMPGIAFGPSQDYETVVGLEGDRTDATFAQPEQNLSGTMAIVAVGHGRRLVVAAWISYQGPIDEEGLDAFLDSLRVDT